MIAEENSGNITFQVERGPGIFGVIGVMWQVRSYIISDPQKLDRYITFAVDHYYIRC